MRIATYNIWNERKNIGLRLPQLFDEIEGINADIIGLQEVTEEFYSELIKSTVYPFHVFFEYEKGEEGLAFLSKFPIKEEFCLNFHENFGKARAINILFEAGEFVFSATNVHLPWDSAMEREKQIVAINEYTCGQRETADFFILLGEFNCSHQSSVQNFLLGDQSLFGYEANPVWNDLAVVHAALNSYEIIPTLDFNTNPRWGGKNTNYIPVACDRIFIKESLDFSYDFRLMNVEVFGKEISQETGFAPSDHYGVLAEVGFLKHIFS